MYKLQLLKNNKITNITDLAGDITLNTNIDTLGANFDFSSPRSTTEKFDTDKIENGDIIKFDIDKNIFTGVVIDIDISQFKKTFKCFDFYFYLNKNKVIKQFNELEASRCVEELLKSIGAKVGKITKIPTKITKIYKNNTVAEIIKDILEKAAAESGKKYKMEINGITFDLLPYEKIKVKIVNHHSISSVSKSIGELKNSVLVVSNDQEDESIYATAKDENSIKKYGMLQELIEVDPENDDISKVRNIANKKLKELNRIGTIATVEVLGDWNLKAGRIIDLEIESYELDGTFLIKDVTHFFKNNNHITRLELTKNEL